MKKKTRLDLIKKCFIESEREFQKKVIEQKVTSKEGRIALRKQRSGSAPCILNYHREQAEHARMYLRE